jgi:hypothetical protein
MVAFRSGVVKGWRKVMLQQKPHIIVTLNMAVQHKEYLPLSKLINYGIETFYIGWSKGWKFKKLE